jgi:hypothetical protein
LTRQPAKSRQACSRSGFTGTPASTKRSYTSMNSDCAMLIGSPGAGFASYGTPKRSAIPRNAR